VKDAFTLLLEKGYSYAILVLAVPSGKAFSFVNFRFDIMLYWLLTKLCDHFEFHSGYERRL